MSSPEASDERWMRRCITLARRAEGRTSPNPMVGAVVVDPHGERLAEGYHRRAGEPHAEAVALAHAGQSARGATLYVNLEPCHHAGRTPPCAPAIAAAGIRKVVFGSRDPHPGHGGATWLRRRGVEVVGGVLEDACEELNRYFRCWALERRSYFVLKAGLSLDGRIATGTGESRWVTGEEARSDGHRWRDRLDAIVVGVGTVLADDPALTARLPRTRDPVRVVVDSRLRTPTGAAILPANSQSSARVIIATTGAPSERRQKRLEATGAEVWRLRSRGGRVSLADLGRRLGAGQLSSCLVEGGGTVHAAFLKAGLADELLLYLAPKIIGGSGAKAGPSWVGGGGIRRLVDAPAFEFVGAPVRFGDDLRLRARRR